MTQFEGFASFSQKPFIHQPPRLPVIIVPGMKGSLLVKGENKQVWGKSYRVAFAYKFDDLQLELEPQLNDDKFKTYYDRVDISDGGIMKDYWVGIRVLCFMRISVYQELKDILKEVGGYDNKNLYTFSYDWRLDNRIAAVRLAKAVQKIQIKYRQYLEQTLKGQFRDYWDKLADKGLLTPDEERIRVNLVAHSMGGLVSRYYLQMLKGDEEVNKLIMLGTPNLGAMDSLKALAEGEYPEALFHFYSEESTRPIIFSWASTFQLLPRYREALLNKNNTPISDQEYEIWGLGLNTSPITDQIIMKWKDYDLVPEIDESEEREENEQIVDNFLKYQLKDSKYFHLAIAGENTNDPEENRIVAEYEKKKIRGCMEFLGVDLSLPDGLRPAVDTRMLIFGGCCSPTLKYAFLDEVCERRGLFGKSQCYHRLNFKDRPLSQSEDQIKDNTVSSGIALGDARVPVDSLMFPQKNNRNLFNFLICEDHMGLVKNETFQYNLLRELLLN
jgi:pimeloyl-ACP methyl ester carboxylesterase